MLLILARLKCIYRDACKIISIFEGSELRYANFDLPSTLNLKQTLTVRFVERGDDGRKGSAPVQTTST